MNLYLGLDLGTSGCRAVVIDQNQCLIAFSQQPFPEPKRNGNRVEQDPQIWWRMSQQVISEVCRQVDSSKIRSIAVDGTSATVMLINHAGLPQTTALMYNDARSNEQATRIAQIANEEGIDAAASQAATSSLAKLCWWQDNDIALKDRIISHQADWITGKLCNQFGVSDSNNCLKLGYDAVQHQWPAWLQKLSLPSSVFPKVFLPGEKIATLSKHLAAKFNLSSNTQVVAGTTDSTASVIATGSAQVGHAISTLGSTLVLKILASQPISSAQFGVYSQPLFDQWLIGGASNTGGAVMQQFFSDQQIQTLSTQIDPQHSTGLDYYPLLVAGERFPMNDPDHAPIMTPRPDNDLHFFQAILEGIAKIEKRGYQRLTELGAQYPTQVISMGGGAKNSAWCQMRERILGVPVRAATIKDAAYGTAILAKSKLSNE